MEAPWIVLIDDGELEDVREILNDLGADFVHWTKIDVPRMAREPSRLLVITASLAAALDYRRSPGRDPDRAIWIALTENDSRSQRRLILDSGFDYQVERPVHPTALRMLLERAVFKGEEQRGRRRVAVGYEVTYRVGLRSRSATLIDLSPGGCRLLTKQPVDEGYRVTVHFPCEIAGTASFAHPGIVVRQDKGSLAGGEEGEVTLGIRFAKFAPDVRDKMRDLLNHLSAGPPTLPEAVESPTSPSLSAGPATSGGGLVRDWANRREPRGQYKEEVAIFGMEGCVLQGADLSKSGLRVDAHPALTEGAEIRLALPARTGEPIVVGAKVLRDDGERGVALRFSWVEFGCEERLDELVDSLSEIQALSPDQAEEHGVVLTKLLPTLLRRTEKKDR